MTPAKPPLVVITGPTATGKTAAALELSRHLSLEVINGDSRLFYRGMNVGTAKPSAAELDAVPHNLIDILNPSETMTLAEFQDLVNALIPHIHRRGNLPVIVGGTQQYINAVIEGWKIPRVTPQPELRAHLEAEAKQHGREHLLRRLTELDPAAANSTGPNLRRVIRALEVIHVTGEPISAQQGKSDTGFAPLLIGLTMPRDHIYRRVDQRVREMIQGGLVEEVQHLLDRGISPTAPAFTSIGYRQVIPYLEGDTSLNEMIAHIQFDTHKLVRHQQTWLRKSKNLVAIDVTEPGWSGLVRERILMHLERHPIPAKP